MKEKTLNLKDKKIKGNILDLGYKDYGIIYNICKRDNERVDINYAMDEAHGFIEKVKYNSCVLFFAFKNMWTSAEKEKVFDLIYNALEDEGEIYIWDIDKGIKKTFNYKVKVILSENSVKMINIRDFNLFNDNSKENIIKILTCKFDIIDFDFNDELYFIRAKKKGC